jgi:hypothetical protein
LKATIDNKPILAASCVHEGLSRGLVHQRAGSNGGPAGTRRVFGARARRPNTPDVSFCPSVVWAVRNRVCRSLFHFEKLHLIHGYYAVTQLAEFSVTQLFATEKTGQQFKRCLARALLMVCTRLAWEEVREGL